MLIFDNKATAQDACSSAVSISIASGGYGLGTFNSAQVDISSATVETGETFQPTILSAGLTNKSIWFRFSIPTTRNVGITLSQLGTAIAAGDVGIAVYKANTCLPTGFSKFTAISTFSTSQNSCIEKGDYLIQVSGNSNANGPVYISLSVSNLTGAEYDLPVDASPFGVVSNAESAIEYLVECQSIEDASETCPTLFNDLQYTKSTWHTFTTPAYFDYVALGIGGQSCGSFPNGQSTFGINIYRGDAAISPVGTLIPVGGCDSIVSDGYAPGFHVYRCGELQPNTTYSVHIFYHEDFVSMVRLSLSVVGVAPTQAPQAILSSVPATNRLGVLTETTLWNPITANDYLGCNSRHSLHPCNPALPNQINAFGINYNLSTFYTFQLSTTSGIQFSAYKIGRAHV